MSLLKSDSRWHLLAVPVACLPLFLLLLYPPVGNWTLFLGRFHIVILHLPIGILLLTALMELLHLVSFGRVQFASRIPVFCGALSAVLAMALGILLMSGASMEGALVESHFNWGIATAFAAVLALLIRSLPGFERAALVRASYRCVLFSACLIMIWASHKGASITHGENYLTDYMPWFDDEGPSEDDEALAAGLNLPMEEREVYGHLIAPIFQGKCYDCHQTRSFKGGLVMDTPEGLLAGGETGLAVVPGDLTRSLAITRVHLPLADEEHMPPANEPQLTDGEIRLLEWWITQGAPFEASIAELEPADELADAIDLVTADLLAALERVPEQEDDVLSDEEVAALREPYATALEALMTEYAGKIRYISAQSEFVQVTCFQETWTDAEVQSLAPIAPIIKKVNLPASQLTAASAEVLNLMVGLEVLNLPESEIEEGFLAALSLPGLQRLNLFETAITDSDAANLARMNNLDSLYLGRSGVSEEVLNALKEALSGCRIVH